MSEVSPARRGEYLQAVVRVLAEKPEGRPAREALDIIERQFTLTERERVKTAKGLSRFRQGLHFDSVGLVKAGWIRKVDGTWSATDAGIRALRDYPDPFKFREEVRRLYVEWADGRPDEDEPEELEDGGDDETKLSCSKAALAQRRRDPAEAQELVEELFPIIKERLVALEMFADAVQKADRLDGMCWGVTLRGTKIHLNVGRVMALGLYDEFVRLGLVKDQLAPEGLVAIERAGATSIEEYKAVQGAAVWGIPAKALGVVRDLIEPAFDEFLSRAQRSSRSLLWQESHSPGVLRYVESTLARSLPRPGYAQNDGPGPVPKPPPKTVAFRHPRVQFRDLRQDLDGLLKLIEIGDIALPDIQRPFVWPAKRVRDLFDSMFRGFPVGTLMLWETTPNSAVRQIGSDPKQRIASRLVVDGQQRLTSLFSVMRGRPVVDETFAEKRIEIAFRPRDGAFDVPDAAIRKDPEYIPDISVLWTSGKAARRLTNEFVENLRARRELTYEDEEAISDNLDRLIDLTKYPFTVLEIAADVDEEAVADIFVRINNGGAKLNQADFILTLLSVFSPETRRALEDFSKRAFEPGATKASSPFNHLIQPTPDQLLRVAVAVAFHRARLSSVYQLLRGKDPDTGVLLPEVRDQHFARLAAAVGEVLDFSLWHLLLGYLVGAGFRSGELISSETAVLNTYALYLLGRRIGVEEKLLSRLVARWFFLASVAKRYSGSSETVMEEDLVRLRGTSDPAAFVRVLEEALSKTATNGFWEITLPYDLETSSTSSPAARAFLAAQVKLGAPVLFSDRRISEMLDPAIVSPRKALEGHHLFPRAWLRRQGIEDTKLINQVANLTQVEWPDNAAVSDAPPAEYAPALRAQFKPEAWSMMNELHAMPDGWDRMTYPEFLAARRKLMAGIIRRGYEAL